MKQIGHRSADLAFRIVRCLGGLYFLSNDGSHGEFATVVAEVPVGRRVISDSGVRLALSLVNEVLRIATRRGAL